MNRRTSATAREPENRPVSLVASPDAESLSPAVTRAVAILDVLSDTGRVPLGLSDLAGRLGLPKSSTSNICAVLAELGLLRRAGNGFLLGRRLAEFGGAYLASVDQVQQFRDIAQSLAVASEQTIQLGVLDGFDVTYLARHDGRHRIQLTSSIGRRLPAHCTAIGKAALATLDDEERDRRLAQFGRNLPTLTPRSHKSIAALLADLNQVRKRGHAIDDEETIPGVICYAVAVPTLRPQDDRYADSVTLQKGTTSAKQVTAIVKDLTQLATALSDPLNGDR